MAFAKGKTGFLLKAIPAALLGIGFGRWNTFGRKSGLNLPRDLGIPGTWR